MRKLTARRLLAIHAGRRLMATRVGRRLLAKRAGRRWLAKCVGRRLMAKRAGKGAGRMLMAKRAGKSMLDLHRCAWQEQYIPHHPCTMLRWPGACSHSPRGICRCWVPATAAA